FRCFIKLYIDENLEMLEWTVFISLSCLTKDTSSIRHDFLPGPPSVGSVVFTAPSAGSAVFAAPSAKSRDISEDLLFVDPMGTDPTDEPDLVPHRTDDVVLVAKERDGAEVAFCTEDQRDTDELDADELLGTEDQNDADELLGTEDRWPQGTKDLAFVVATSTPSRSLMIPRADASSCSSSSDSRASSVERGDEDIVDEVEQTKKAASTQRAKVRPDPPSTDHLSYLTDFRVRGRSEELKHTVTNASGMALIAGFPSKDDHFEDRFFFVEIFEKTVEVDCIDLVKTRWERRVKPSLPEVSKKFVKAMHKELSSGNGNWKESFSRKRIKRVFSAEIILGKILRRSRMRVSSREQAGHEAAAKAARSSDTNTPRAVLPMTLTPTAASARGMSSRPLAPKTPPTSTLPPPPSLSSGELAEFCRISVERARISSGKGKGIDREPPSKKRRVDTSHVAVVDRETSASGVALPLLSLFFDHLVGDYDEDVRFRDNELRVAKETTAALESRLDELTERNQDLERDALSVQKIKKDCDAKLAKLKLKCAKGNEEIASLKTLLSSASDL
ncbi:hypothetical protein AALP_AAs72208U000100, partial [Arabis alpina]